MVTKRKQQAVKKTKEVGGGSIKNQGGTNFHKNVMANPFNVLSNVAKSYQAKGYNMGMKQVATNTKVSLT